jgi:hypothetical protein
MYRFWMEATVKPPLGPDKTIHCLLVRQRIVWAPSTCAKHRIRQAPIELPSIIFQYRRNLWVYDVHRFIVKGIRSISFDTSSSLFQVLLGLEVIIWGYFPLHTAFNELCCKRSWGHSLSGTPLSSHSSARNKMTDLSAPAKYKDVFVLKSERTTDWFAKCHRVLPKPCQLLGNPFQPMEHQAQLIWTAAQCLEKATPNCYP